MEAKIRSLLPGHPWQNTVFFFSSLDSTNDRLRTLARQGAPEGTVLIAGHQTNGHGRRGRSFQSPEGMGVYLSVLLRPECLPRELMHLTCAAAVAMCDALDSLGVEAQIKWTNDLVIGRRKLGGILTELGFTPQGALDYAIVGIGINCCQGPEDFPPDLRDMATSLSLATGTPADPARVAAAMIMALSQMDLLTGKEAMLEAYRRRCITLGQEIRLHRGEEIRQGFALDIGSEGALVVRFPDGHTEAVTSGEVSVRGMYGYL